MTSVQFFSILISLGVLLLGLISAIVSGVAYIIRLEGRLSAMGELRDSIKRFYDAELSHINEKLGTAVAALSKFDENTQEEVKQYRQHTENKIDELGRNMSAKFEKVFDKLDQKQDKA